MKFFKGTREFTISIYNDPLISLIDTISFGNMIFEYHKEKDGIKITDNLGQINIDDEPALSFSYSEVNKEVMASAILHDNVGYVFKYGTLKDNFDQDFDTMMHFFASIKF